MRNDKADGAKGVKDMKDVTSRVFTTYELESWRDFDEYDSKSPQTVYRGHADADWALETLYHRVQRVLNPMRELEMLRSFISQAGVYQADLPEPHDYVSWLALMQHCGAGTRLLDVSRSKYIALWFAVMGMVEHGCEKDGAVWVFKTYGSNISFYNKMLVLKETKCVDTRDAPFVRALEEYKQLGWRFANELIKADVNMSVDKITDEVVAPYKDRLDVLLKSGGVIRVVPKRLNKRMIAQAGEFLVPVTLRKTFEENLNAETEISPEVVKLIIPRRIVRELFEKLEAMNINYQTLFPDISGLARNTI